MSDDIDPDDQLGPLAADAPAAFSEASRAALYQAIALRRDVRHFAPDRPIADDVLERILGAAHQAPSVGLSQPWHFIVVRDRGVRDRVRASFLACRAAEAARFPPERRAQYLRHKLEGILEAPLNLCVVVDLRDRADEGVILGTTVQPEALRASATCAVQNLWLAARAEGIGAGWVSIVEPAVLRAELALPAGIEPIAYLCLGHPVGFRQRPMLEETAWGTRRPLAQVVHAERFTAPPPLAPPPRETRATPAPVTFDAQAAAASTARQARLIKPPGSLGRLEALAAQYAGAHGQYPPPAPDHAALAIFAADHGVVAEGTSAYGSPATAAMVAAIMTGGAAINAIAAAHDVALTLVDVGVAGDLSPTTAPTLAREAPVALVRRKIAPGTRNLRHEPAMTAAERDAALAVGAEVAAQLAAAGARLVGVGEVGIGNTTAAAALIAVFTGRAPAEVVGRGTGLDGAGVAHKAAVIEAALGHHRPRRDDPLGTLAAVGGLEIAAMVGFILAAPRHHLPVVLDGYVTNAAALCACALEPGVRPFLLAAHQSAEPGARHALAALDLPPLLSLDLRLGEGTGAVIAMDLVRTAVKTEREMATFATAGLWPPRGGAGPA